MARIVILVPKNAVSSSVTLAHDILTVAATTAAGQMGGTADQVILASQDGADIRCGEVSFHCSAMSEIESCALVWVAGYWGDPIAGLETNAAMAPWLSDQRMSGAMIAAQGPATFLLAKAGILDGKVATTYAAQAAPFASVFPQVDLQPNRLITDAGGIFCSVGMNSGGDLLVMLVEKLYGKEIAASVADWALVDSQRSYRKAMMAFEGQKYHGDAEVLQIQTWMERNYDQHVAILKLATMVNMSGRTLARRFKAATGETPSQYLGRLRIEAAKDLLHQTHLSVAEVAHRVGYQDVGGFYDAFFRNTALRPAEYRQTVLNASVVNYPFEYQRASDGIEGPT